MRKRLISEHAAITSPPPADWLNLEELAEVEINSEDAAHPIEAALLGGSGWRAAQPGRQTIRLLFPRPQHVRRILLAFVEPSVQRTQEYLLRWSGDGGLSFREIVRQQWNFSPPGASSQTEQHEVDLSGVGVLELIITPDIGNSQAFASLARLRLA